MYFQTTYSVVKPWLADQCSFKAQTVLLSALRGCDGVPKEDVSKQLVRKFRSVVLNSAAKTQEPGTFMGFESFGESVKAFLDNLDHYPVHWLMHFAHACEIIGYKHPDRDVRKEWEDLYYSICTELHLWPESERQMELRLADNL